MDVLRIPNGWNSGENELKIILHIDVTTMAPAIRTTVCKVSVYITDASPPESENDTFKLLCMMRKCNKRTTVNKTHINE